MAERLGGHFAMVLAGVIITSAYYQAFIITPSASPPAAPPPHPAAAFLSRAPTGDETIQPAPVTMRSMDTPSAGSVQAAPPRQSIETVSSGPAPGRSAEQPSAVLPHRGTVHAFERFADDVRRVRMPMAITEKDSDGLYAARGIPVGEDGGAASSATPAVIKVPTASRHCLGVWAQPSNTVVVNVQRGHERVIGCQVPDVTVDFEAVNAQGPDELLAPLNHLVVSVSPMPGEDSASKPCRVDFVAAVSIDASSKPTSSSVMRFCKPLKPQVLGPPFANWSNWYNFGSLRYPPAYKVSSGSVSKIPVEFVSIERTEQSGVTPFLQTPATGSHPPSSRFSLRSLLDHEPQRDGHQSSTGGGGNDSPSSQLDAPVRCDQGEYMGFTNLIEALVACVTMTTLSRRNHAEFPNRFQHESFTTLFDAQQLLQRARDWYGVHVSFLPPREGVEVHGSLIAGFVPKVPKEANKFALFAGARPGARMFVGDVWRNRLNTMSERQQTRWFTGHAYLPAGRLRSVSNELIDKMSAKAQSAGTKWAALHLRLEPDKWTLGKTASTSEQKLDKVKAHLRTAMDGGDRVPAYYASGALEASMMERIPSSWINKNDFYDKALWSDMFDGRWFDGRLYRVTNATGSLVDMFVLLEAPMSYVAGFSSFGEFVAALRCGANKPTMLYDHQAEIRLVDCKRLILFLRDHNDDFIRQGCNTLKHTPGSGSECGKLAQAYTAFKSFVRDFDKVVKEAASAIKERPT